MTCCQLDPLEQTSVKFEAKLTNVFHENTIENVVWETAAILFRRIWVVNVSTFQRNYIRYISYNGRHRITFYVIAAKCCLQQWKCHPERKYSFLHKRVSWTQYLNHVWYQNYINGLYILAQIMSLAMSKTWPIQNEYTVHGIW